MRRLVTILAASLVMMLGLAGPALAHDTLISSDPAEGATLTKSPTEVSFTFDLPVKDFNTQLRVFGPNGHNYTTGAPVITGATVSATMAAGPAGEYCAAFRIVSADGHPVTGQIHFTLADSAAGTANGTPTAEDVNCDNANESDSAESSGLGAWWWVVAAIVLILAVGAILIAARRPRSDET